MSKRIIELTRNLVTGVLTEGGEQYTAAVDTTTLDVDVVVALFTVNTPVLDIPSPARFLLQELELSLTCRVRAVSTATADLKWKWQIRNKDAATWNDLMADYVTETDINTTYVSQYVGRYVDVEAASPVVNQLPFDLRLLLQCNETNEGRGQVANSSQIRLIGTQ